MELIMGTIYYYGYKLTRAVLDALLVLWLLWLIHKLVSWGLWVMSL